MNSMRVKASLLHQQREGCLVWKRLNEDGINLHMDERQKDNLTGDAGSVWEKWETPSATVRLPSPARQQGWCVSRHRERGCYEYAASPRLRNDEEVVRSPSPRADVHSTPQKN